MYLKISDLEQLNDNQVLRLPQEQKDELMIKLLSDLKEAHDRLNANSQTSSRPPSSDSPWSSGVQSEDEDNPEDSVEGEVKLAPSIAGEELQKSTTESEGQRKRPGRQRGAQGHSRQVSLPISATVIHYPERCVVCGQALESELFLARTGLYVLDVEQEHAQGLCGLRVRHDKHLYGEIACSCGHVNHSEPGRCPDEPLWEVALSEWHLVGPLLASLIVCLSHRLRLSRRSSQEFLRDWLGIELSTATLTQCLHEAGRAVEPLEDALVEELRQAQLVYADETSWKEWGEKLWLWVITTSTVCLFLIGYRSKEILDNVFEQAFVGWLMSDGYSVYRDFKHRLRCWAHLDRKASGLKASLSPVARRFGRTTKTLLKDLTTAIKHAREGPAVDLRVQYQDRIETFRLLCERHRHCDHKKTRELAREFLNDWDAIWVVVSYPHLPLTNNEAERALRHWVIARRISHGTRTEQGSRALALLASVIETCRKRQILPWPYLANVIAQRRRGLPAPPLPQAATIA